MSPRKEVNRLGAGHVNYVANYVQARACAVPHVKTEPAVNDVTRKVLCHVIHCAKNLQPRVTLLRNMPRVAPSAYSCVFRVQCSARIAWILALITVSHVALIAKCVKDARLIS